MCAHAYLSFDYQEEHGSIHDKCPSEPQPDTAVRRLLADTKAAMEEHGDKPWSGHMIEDESEIAQLRQK